MFTSVGEKKYPRASLPSLVNIIVLFCYTPPPTATPLAEHNSSTQTLQILQKDQQNHTDTSVQNFSHEQQWFQHSGTHFQKTSDFLSQFLPLGQHSTPTHVFPT